MTHDVLEQCPRCFGRGYTPESRKPSRRNPYGLGFYARTCRRCGGSGQSVVKRRTQSPQGTARLPGGG